MSLSEWDCALTTNIISLCNNVSPPVIKEFSIQDVTISLHVVNITIIISLETV